MNVRLARAVIALYPRSWRHRYGAEFADLLQSLPASPSVVADALLEAGRQRAWGIAVTAACIALLAVFGLRLSERPATTRAYTVAHSRTVVCRTYSSVSKAEHVAAFRCLD